jgi:hypothetical protein
MEKKDLVMVEYSIYTFEDMEAEEKGQLAKANNVDLSPAIRRDALDRLEVIEVVKSVFMDVVNKGISPVGMRVDQAFFAATGKALHDMKTSSMLSSATNTFISSTDKIVDVAIEKSKIGLNKFASWLANKTNK